MNDFLQSLRSDLLSRPLLPLLIVACLGLVGAGVYVATSSGSSPSTGESGSPPSAAVSTSKSGLNAASEVKTNPNVAVSETTSGVRYQNQGQAHNPFKALPAPPASKTQTSTTSTGTTSTSPATTTGSSTTPTSTVEKPTTPTKKQSKPGPVYTVSLEFGPLPSNPSQTPAPEVKKYENLERLAPIPSKSNALLVFTGVGPSGKTVVLTMTHEAIIRGEGVCLPSASQCETLDMAVGKTEELDYLQPNGETVAYKLKVTGITKSTKNANTASRVSKAGETLLKREGWPVLRRLRFSQSKGVLLYIPHR
ncbi:MAG: hypothetical protein ACRDK2_00355 [Solirubrobacteraceae bacterium]